MEQNPQSQLKLLVTRGKEQGYLTYAEVNDHLPEDIVDSDQIEDIIQMINDMGIQVMEEAPDADDLMLAENTADEDAAEAAAQVLSSVESEIGRTTDPVRMYMREMGTVELLTREGEIDIAKRIEDGINQVQCSVAEYPEAITYLLEQYDRVEAEEARLSDLITGFVDPNAEEEEISEEDIRMMADAGSEKGVIAAEENEMIQNVFAFNDWTAEEIMTHRTELQLLWERDSLDSWKQTIRQTPHRYYPICGEHTDDILGVLDTRKLFAVAEQTKECVMKTAVVPAFFIPSTAKANDVFHSMRKAGQSYAIVLDEFGGTDGVLTILDLMERLVGSLDEAADASELQEENGIYRIAGNCELERMEETLRMQLPETDATTAGGWIVEQLGRIPHTGETLLLHGYQFQIEKANPRKVLLFSATPHTESASTAAF